MSTLGELARQHTELTKEQTTHLVNLVSEWGMLADLCFADLMLHVPVEGGQHKRCRSQRRVLLEGLAGGRGHKPRFT